MQYSGTPIYCSSYSLEGSMGVGHAYTAEDIIPFSVIGNGELCLSNLGTVFSVLLKCSLENPLLSIEAQARGSRVARLGSGSRTDQRAGVKLPENLERVAVIEVTDPIREGG